MSAKKTPKTKAPSAKPKKIRKARAEEAAPTLQPLADAPEATTDPGPGPEPVALEPIPAEAEAPVPVAAGATPAEAAEASPATAEQSAAELPQTPEPAPAKPQRRRKAKKPKDDQPEKKVSALDAAARVLAEAGQALTCQEMIETMAAKGYWTSPGGKTPHPTLYAALPRAIQGQGAANRFQKTERGKFARTAAGGEG